MAFLERFNKAKPIVSDIYKNTNKIILIIKKSIKTVQKCLKRCDVW